MRKPTGLFGSVLVIGTLAGTPAVAAPQILAVIAPSSAQPLRCGGELCATDFTSYCLQRERDIPTTGQAYLPANAAHFSLIVTLGDGTEKRFPAGAHVDFNSQRGYASVKATIRYKDLAALGAKEARLEVKPGAALVPQPMTGDPNPISEAELAYASGSLREHGNEIVDAQPSAQAATIVNRLATTIIPSMPVDRPALDRLWHDVIDNLGPAQPAGRDAIERARDIYEWCQGRSSYHSMSGIKSCLEFKHDDTIMHLNSDYWNSQPSY